MNIGEAATAASDTGTASDGSVTLHWDRNPTTSADLPLSELVISVKEVCKNDNNNAKEIDNDNDWPLRVTGNNNQNSCEGGVDSTFVPFFTYRYVDYLELNQAFPPPALTNLIASYSPTEDMILFKRSYVPLRKSCRGKAKDMEENDNEVDQMRNAQLGLLIVAGIVAIVIGFVIAILDAIILLHKNKICVLA
jgi:hypothetical protein